MWLRNWQDDLRRSAVVCGILQMFACLGLLFARYPAFVASQYAQVDARYFDGAMRVGGESAVRAFGLILLAAYIFLPSTLLVIYFAVEGLVRWVAAIVTGEVIGTLPVFVAEIVAAKYRAHLDEKKQGERVPDLVSTPPVEGSGYDLMVASCRQKDWNELSTISYNDALYELAHYFIADPPRRHVYLLRKAPVSKVVRGLHHYSPEEVLTH